MPLPRTGLGWTVAIALTLAAAPGATADVQVHLPLQRTAYQTNEWIDVSVVRSGKSALAAGALKLRLVPLSFQGGEVSAAFAVEAGTARRVEHLHVNGWLLRPGTYRVEAAIGEERGTAEIEVFTHLRQSSFRTVNWGRAQKEQQLAEGEDSFGFNLYYGDETKDHLLRAGVDCTGVCVMSGAHQMDIRLECDWSDPYVIQGGTRRVVRRALADRTRPNVPGVHFYDEPGLTWAKHPVTGQFVPHDIPAQLRSYQAAYEKTPPPYHELDPKNAAQARRWKHWITWKLGLMDAAWKDAQFGVARVRPDFLSLTQSQYGWSAFTDGYYFTVARSLPVTSGHGGYHDFGPGFFNPSLFLEMSRARDQYKPCWYLPCWYGNTTSDQFRLEQYLAFQTGIQGMISPPDLEPAINASARAGIVETNQLFKRLGPVFTTMKHTKSPVAMLYSLSAAIHDQVESRGTKNSVHEMRQGRNLTYTYLAGKLIQQPFDAVLDEDVRDGSVAAERKVLIVTSVDYLDPQVVRNLEEFIGGGGRVLLTADCKVQIHGARGLGVTPGHPDQARIDQLQAELKTEKDKTIIEQKQRQLARAHGTGRYLAGAMPLARAIAAELQAAGVRPVAQTGVPTLVTTRHGTGDVRYVFVVNATPDDDAVDAKGNPLPVTPKAVESVVKLDAAGRHVYDALLGTEAPELATGATLRFGPGQMRVYAVTARPIGGVRLAEPQLSRDLVQERAPVQLHLAGSVVDDRGEILAGAVPLSVRVIDPYGAVRHELFRATAQGLFTLDVPLAANDPSGKWWLEVRDLVSGRPARKVRFEYWPPAQVRAIAGATPRAVSFGGDRDRIFRFARTFQDVTLVKGKSAYNDAAAKRLAQVLAPWGIRCKELDLAQAAKARPLTDDEARTWVGLVYTGSGQIKPGDKNAPALAGFNVRGPVLLLGNPQDNPLIDFLLKEKFLPYAPDPATLPGPGRGYLAWQRDGVGPGQESVTLIAYDAAGMAEAVGSLYEAAAGLEPLTRWTLPAEARSRPAESGPRPHVLETAWEVRLPDRVDALRPDGTALLAVSHDGTLARIAGKAVGEAKVLPPAEYAKFIKEAGAPVVPGELAKKLTRPDRMLSHVAADGGRAAAAYWGGTLRLVDQGGAVLAEQQMPQDVTALAWFGGRLVVGLADGRVRALEVPR